MLYTAAREPERVAVRLWHAARCGTFGEVSALELYEDFRIWLLRHPGVLSYMPGPAVFGAALMSLGLEKRRKRGLTYYLGISLKTEVDSGVI